MREREGVVGSSRERNSKDVMGRPGGAVDREGEREWFDFYVYVS